MHIKPQILCGGKWQRSVVYCPWFWTIPPCQLAFPNGGPLRSCPTSPGPMGVSVFLLSRWMGGEKKTVDYLREKNWDLYHSKEVILQTFDSFLIFLTIITLSFPGCTYAIQRSDSICPKFTTELKVPGFLNPSLLGFHPPLPPPHLTVFLIFEIPIQEP